MIWSSVMTTRIKLLLVIALAMPFTVGTTQRTLAETETQQDDHPKPIPRTRPEMKRWLEDLKLRESRLPLPPVSASDAAATASPDAPGRTVVNNSRMRSQYLPASWHVRAFRSDPDMTVDDALKVRLFWIVSRLNNCHYCLGHQEHKLLAAGMTEDQIAALDSAWNAFLESDQVAMEFARKLTVDPAGIVESDFERLRAHWDDQQIIELVHSVASNNATNRWTDSLGIPQDSVFRNHPLELDTATSPEFTHCESTVFVTRPNQAAQRIPLDAFRKEVEQANTSRRSPRVKYPRTDAAESPQWLLALSSFPQSAAAMKQQWDGVTRDGLLNLRHKWELRWIVARELNAEYAMSFVWKELHDQGVPVDTLMSLDAVGASATEGDEVARRFARKLTLQPHRITDADIAELRKHFSDAKVAETVYVVCQANWFARFTEALHLPLEPVTR
jgi:AhpD family alkylhydroperoxidase